MLLELSLRFGDLACFLRFIRSSSSPLRGCRVCFGRQPSSCRDRYVLVGEQSFISSRGDGLKLRDSPHYCGLGVHKLGSARKPWATTGVSSLHYP